MRHRLNEAEQRDPKTFRRGNWAEEFRTTCSELSGTLRLLWPFTIPGAAASARRHDHLVAPPGTLTLAAHPMALPAASRAALTTPPIDTLSPLAPDTTWPYDEVMSYVELNIKNGWATRPRHTHETFQPWPRPRDAPRSHRDLSHRNNSLNLVLHSAWQFRDRLPSASFPPRYLQHPIGYLSSQVWVKPPPHHRNAPSPSVLNPLT